MLDTNLNGSHLRFALVGSGPHGTVHKIPESGLIRAQKMIEADSILQHVPNFVENWSTFQRDMIGPEGANLVAVYAAESKEDYVSIRMSYQRGGCLRQLIRRRGFMPPNPQELYHLIDSVRAGMIEAESERNVKVHGNLKPENLLFAEYLKSNEPLWQSAIKLSDFGLLGLPQAVETHKAYDYREAWGYVAPEICTDLSLLKSHAKLKPSTDVYALAVIIYELLQGVRPRPVKSIQYWRQKETLVPTPEPKDGYSAPFWAVVLKGLAVEPENRFEDVDLFVKALEQFLQTPGDPPNRGEDGRSEAGPDISEPISSLNRVEIGQFEQHTEDTLIVTGGGTDASTGNEVTGAIFILRNDRISIGNHTKLGADSKKPDISLPHEHIAGYHAELTRQEGQWSIIAELGDEYSVLDENGNRLTPVTPTFWEYDKTFVLGSYRLTLRQGERQEARLLYADLRMNPARAFEFILLLRFEGDKSDVFQIDINFLQEEREAAEADQQTGQDDGRVNNLASGLNNHPLISKLNLERSIVNLDPHDTKEISIKLREEDAALLPANTYQFQVEVRSVTNRHIRAKKAAEINIPRIYKPKVTFEVASLVGRRKEKSLDGRIRERGVVTARIENKGNTKQTFRVEGKSNGKQVLQFKPLKESSTRFLTHVSDFIEEVPVKNQFENNAGEITVSEYQIEIRPKWRPVFRLPGRQLSREAKAKFTIIPLEEGEGEYAIEPSGRQELETAFYPHEKTVEVDISARISTVPSYILALFSILFLVLLFLVGRQTVIPLLFDWWINPRNIGDENIDGDDLSNAQEILQRSNPFVFNPPQLSLIEANATTEAGQAPAPQISSLQTEGDSDIEDTISTRELISDQEVIRAWTVVEKGSLSGVPGGIFDFDINDGRADLLYVGDNAENERLVIIGCFEPGRLIPDLDEIESLRLAFSIAQSEVSLKNFGHLHIERLPALDAVPCGSMDRAADGFEVDYGPRLGGNEAIYLGVMETSLLQPNRLDEVQLKLEKRDVVGVDHFWIRLRYELPTNLDDAPDLLKLISQSAEHDALKPSLKINRIEMNR